MTAIEHSATELLEVERLTMVLSADWLEQYGVLPLRITGDVLAVGTWKERVDTLALDDLRLLFGVGILLERFKDKVEFPKLRQTHGGVQVGHAEVIAEDVVVVANARTVRPEQLRLEWGSENSPDYAGWLQVEHAEPGHSSVVMHLSFLGDQPETRSHGDAAGQVRGWLDDALGRLERVVAGAS